MDTAKSISEDAADENATVYTPSVPYAADFNVSHTGDNDDRVIMDDVFTCLSKNKEVFRLVLTKQQLILHNSKNHAKVERFELEDVFGCQTLRHKKKENALAYICFYLYPRTKKRRLMSHAMYREKKTLVFEVSKLAATYQDNLAVAIAWKQAILAILAEKFPKWQFPKGDNQHNNNKSSKELEMSSLAQDSLDEMDHFVQPGEPLLSMVSYLRFVRRFMIVLNPRSGQGKTLELFQEKVGPILRESGIKMDVLVTQHPGHARNIMSSADLSEIDGIVSIGGDGILYEVVNGLRTRGDAARVSHIPIGVIAGGSGNGLARSLAEYSGEAVDYLKNPVLSTTLAVARGKIKQVNLAEVDLDGKSIFSFLSVGWGLLADIDVESEVLRALGESRFTIWSFYRLAKLRTYKARLSYVPYVKPTTKGAGDTAREPVVVDGDFVCVYSSYQSYIGSDLLFAPSATPNDGIIHLVFLKGDVGRARATQFLISLDRGSHLDVEGVTYVPVTSFTIEREGGIAGNLTIDGERVFGDKMKVRISATPLNMFAL